MTYLNARRLSISSPSRMLTRDACFMTRLTAWIFKRNTERFSEHFRFGILENVSFIRPRNERFGRYDPSRYTYLSLITLFP